MVIKVVNAGNCILCGKPIKLSDSKENNELPNIFFCPKCNEQIVKESKK